MSRSPSLSRASQGGERLLPLIALCLLATIVAGVLGITSRSQPSSSLAGTWPATIEHAGGLEEAELAIPHLVRRADTPAPAVVTWTVKFHSDQDVTDAAVYIERPLYGARISWDGVTIHPPHGASAELPSEQPILAPIPPALSKAGTHRVLIEVQGQYGVAGLLGDVVWGRRGELESRQRTRAFHWTVLTAVLAMMGTIGLILATLRSTRREFTWMGLLFAALAGYAFTQSESWYLVTDALGPRLRLRGGTLLLACAAGVMFTSVFTGRVVRRPTTVIGAVAAILGLFVLVVPSTELSVALSRLAPVVVASTVLWSLWLLLGALRNRVDGAPGVLLALVILVGALLSRLAAAQGIMADPGLFVPGLVFAIGTTTAALLLRDADASTRYEALFAQARDAIVVVDTDGEIVAGNEAADAIAGRDVTGVQWTDLLHTDDAQAGAAHIKRTASARRAELRVIQSTGSHFLVESVAVDLPEGTTMAVLRDITARRKAEEGMVNAARMETVGILARGIAHDFNNTLGALMAHVGMLQVTIGEEEADRLGRMEAVIRRASQMSRRLLTLARGGTGSRVSLEVAPTVHDAVDLTRSMLPPDIEIKERFEPFLPRIFAAPDQVEQAMLNLLVNARDAMRDHGGGVITVEAYPSREQGIVSGVTVRVTDEGPGIPPHIRERILEPFFTTKGQGGTGLGLSVVARIVREHDATIEISEGPGGIGARFTITFPISEDPEITDKVPLATEEQCRTVLVVDDDPDIREMMQRELQARGYEVESADSAMTAQAHFANASGGFDLLVTDVVLPGISGIELAYDLTQKQPSLKVLVVSGFIPEHEDDIPDFWHSIPKPFTAEQLATAVRRVQLQTEPPSKPPRPPSAGSQGG